MFLHLTTIILLFLTTAAVAQDARVALTWSTDYHETLDAAEADAKLALIWFRNPSAMGENERFEAGVLNDERISAAIASRFAHVKLDTTATVESTGQQIALLKHPAFAEMLGLPGLAVIDMTDASDLLFRRVVSVVPFKRGPITVEQLQVLLDLPRGSLTQRSLIFAVRTHPERPASAIGELSPILTRETENHAWHQASIRLQGHHQWDTRFHAINAQLKGGLAAREVCAESWPGQSLVDAAEECVDSWRHSPGHWEAVSSRHALFAYDMKRGANGIWYAAGIFAGK